MANLTDREREILAAHLARQGKLVETVPAKSHITPREREILKLVAHGKDTQYIATIIGISPRTVKRHLANANVTLGCSNRIGALVRSGILKLVDD